MRPRSNIGHARWSLTREAPAAHQWSVFSLNRVIPSSHRSLDICVLVDRRHQHTRHNPNIVLQLKPTRCILGTEEAVPAVQDASRQGIGTGVSAVGVGGCTRNRRSCCTNKSIPRPQLGLTYRRLIISCCGNLSARPRSNSSQDSEGKKSNLVVSSFTLRGGKSSAVSLMDQ